MSHSKEKQVLDNAVEVEYRGLSTSSSGIRSKKFAIVCISSRRVLRKRIDFQFESTYIIYWFNVLHFGDIRYKKGR